MFRRLFLVALAVALGLPTGGCSLLPKRKRKPAAVAAPQPIFTGTVSLVNVEGRFVLIDNGVLPVPSTGARLKSYAGGVETAELIATDVRKRPFTIADIRSGAPRKGDRVFVLPVLGDSAAPPVAPAAPAQPTPAEPPFSEPPQLSPGAADDQ